MNRKELKTYKYTQKWIEKQIENYEEQKALVYRVGQNLDGMPHAQNKPSYKLEELIDQYDRILEILKDNQKKQNEIILQIKEVEEPYRTILTDKYILGMSLEEIAVDINYSYNRACTMHGDALDMFDKLDN